MRANTYMYIILLLLTAVLFSSCSLDNWLSSSRNRDMLLFTLSIPLLVGLFSAILYYYILQSSSPIDLFASTFAWYIWYFCTAILSVALIILLAPGMSNVNIEKWLSKYSGLLGFGILFSMLSFRLFSLRFWIWRRKSKVIHIP